MFGLSFLNIQIFMNSATSANMGDVMKKYTQKYAPFALRLGIGSLFLVAGIFKFIDPTKITGLLQNLGFPFSEFWAWLLVLVELLGGTAVLTGYKLKWVTPPLAVVLIVATVTVAYKQPTNLMIHIALLSGVVSLWLSGPGKFGLDKR